MRGKFGAIDAKDTRANIGFEYYATGSPFEYLWVRSLWFEYRKLEVLNVDIISIGCIKLTFVY